MSRINITSCLDDISTRLADISLKAEGVKNDQLALRIALNEVGEINDDLIDVLEMLEKSS